MSCSLRRRRAARLNSQHIVSRTASFVAHEIGVSLISTSCSLEIFNKFGIFHSLTLKGPGAESAPPPSTFRAISPQRDNLSPRCFVTFFFQVSRNFWDQICRARAYRFVATPFWKKFVKPKIAQKRDFMYKSNVKCVFSINSYKNSYL